MSYCFCKPCHCNCVFLFYCVTAKIKKRSHCFLILIFEYGNCLIS
nr:MAG TPA: hypothetical protein [Caudoviricetes sp.]